MISHLIGTVSFSGDRFVVLDVGGVGYRVNTTLENVRLAGKSSGRGSTKNPLQTSPLEGFGERDEKVRFFTHLAVRENAMDLYGFLSRVELEFFELLITVSGIGPKTALGIMNTAPLETLLSGIAQNDSGYLVKTSGIGAKNAQKIVLELKDKIAGINTVGGEEGARHIRPEFQEEADVLAAIQALGYSLKDARDALAHIPEKSEKNLQEKIREVLKVLGKN